MSVRTQQREKELPGALGEPARAAWGARHLRQTPRRAAFQRREAGRAGCSTDAEPCDGVRLGADGHVWTSLPLEAGQRAQESGRSGVKLGLAVAVHSTAWLL